MYATPLNDVSRFVKTRDSEKAKKLNFTNPGNFRKKKFVFSLREPGGIELGVHS